MESNQIEEALKSLLVDPIVPNWTKVLMNCLSSLINEMAGLKNELDELEQYSRRNCLIFHGIPEEKGESTTEPVLDVIHEKLNIPEVMVSIRDTARTNLGRRNPQARHVRTNVHIVPSS